MPDIADRLCVHLPGARWKMEFVSGRLVEPPTDLTELISAGRRMLLDRGGALGAALETHETVREAAYTYQPIRSFGPEALR